MVKWLLLPILFLVGAVLLRALCAKLRRLWIRRRQRRMLGRANTPRVVRLLDQLEEMSGEEVVFDRDIVPRPVFGTPGGLYHAGEATPRVSLPVGASELTAAHELLHGILIYEDYPCLMSSQEPFQLASEVFLVLLQCALHVVIDSRLHELGFDVLSHRVAWARTCLAAMPMVSADGHDIPMEHWWCIWVACEAAHHAIGPQVPTDLFASFEETARRLFPACGGLVDKFKALVGAMNIDDPKDVQRVLRRMLAAVVQTFGAYSHFAHLGKLCVIVPIFVASKQLDEPAERSAQFEIGPLVSKQKERIETMAVTTDRLSGDTWAVAISAGADDTSLRQHMEKLMKQPLRDLLDYLETAYVEEDSRPGDLSSRPLVSVITVGG